MSKEEKSMRFGRRLRLGFTVAILLIFVVLEIFPFWLSLVQSLQPRDFTVMNTIEIWPQAFSIENYAIAWRDANLELGYLWSLIYSVFFTAVTAVICLITAYVLEKKQFRGRNFVFMFFMSILFGEIFNSAFYTSFYHTTSARERINETR